MKLCCKYFNKLIGTKKSKQRHYRFNPRKAKVSPVLNIVCMNISTCSEEVAREKLSSEDFKCPELLWSIKNSNIFKKKNNQATKQLDYCGEFLLSLICLPANTEIWKAGIPEILHCLYLNKEKSLSLGLKNSEYSLAYMESWLQVVSLL